MPPCRLAIPCCALLALALAGGCTTTRQSQTARTATEQLLIANAIDGSLDKVDFSSLGESKVFVDDKYLECVDKGYLLGSIRHRLLYHGAALVAKPEDAEVILEVRSGAVGTDQANSFIGIPAITLPGMMGIPEVRLLSQDSQQAQAKIGLAAYDAKTLRLLGTGGVSSAQADNVNTYVLGMGPAQHGTLKSEVKYAAARRPGQRRTTLPATVAFAAPAGSAAPPNEVHLSSGEEPDPAGQKNKPRR